MTSIKQHGTAEAPKTTSATRSSRGGIAVLMLFSFMAGTVAVGILHPSRWTAEAAAGGLANEPVSKSARPNQIDPGELHQLYVEVNKIKQENAFLRGEIETLTDRDGIVDKLIDHVKQLQQSDLEIMTLVRPRATDAQDASAAETASPSAAALVRHEVVTPRALRTVESPPIPGKRPDQGQTGDIVEAKASPVGKED
ncbi:hypothetical protein [Rhizobium wenxiniae]|uniref:hypothetical protein n=1 Tax=Rhizobium wenxiniae TaxID=1737357 RepID=UPI003C1A651F